MKYLYDMVLKNGIVVDYAGNRHEKADIGITGDKIMAVGAEINPDRAKECLDLHGLYVMPGIIDIHTHFSSWLGGKWGHKMMALAGVTTALDMSGPVDWVLDTSREFGAGLNVGCLQQVRPGHTVSDCDPKADELLDLLGDSIKKGALGLKILGGHYPLSPEATARVIKIANDNKTYVAFHAGTTNKGSNIEGVYEAVELTGERSVQLCHTNAYCRGYIRPYLEETEEVINLLLKHENIYSDSNLATINACSARCSNGVPESLITRASLKKGGFQPTEEGLLESIESGWGYVNIEIGGKIELVTGKEALGLIKEKTDYTISFQVNPPEPRIRHAVAKRDNGEFVIDCIITDGGGIPRNNILEFGLSLVKIQAISIKEFVKKSSYNASRILGLKNKGHLGVGADADITIFDIDRQTAEITIANGKIIMYKGLVLGKNSYVLTTETGRDYVVENGLTPVITDISSGFFYNGARHLS